MAIQFEVLGSPGRDNALLVTVDTGQSIHRILFDCGEGCLSHVPVRHVQAIEALFFSHFHIDHIAGFDSFLRLNWCRPDCPVRIFGPAAARDVIHHRLRGFTWNLVSGLPGEIQVTEIAETLTTSRFVTSEAYAVDHFMGEKAFDGVVLRGPSYVVEARLLEHGTPSVAYLLRENPITNVDTQKLAKIGLRPGPWLRVLKDGQEGNIEVDGQTLDLSRLREELLTTRNGDSIVYLTDFRLSDVRAEVELLEMLRSCQTIVCEQNYADTDAVLARKNFHMTSSEVGQLAARIAPEQLVLFHLSDRYTSDGWRQQLADVRQHFPRASFPDSWDLDC